MVCFMVFKGMNGVRVSDLAFKEVGLYIIEVDWAMQYSRSSPIQLYVTTLEFPVSVQICTVSTFGI